MKLDKKIELGRNQGLEYALRILKSESNPEEAIKKLENEVKRRGARFVPLEIPMAEYNRFEEEIKSNCLETINIMALVVLHDEFGFGNARLKKFMDKFTYVNSCMDDGLMSWDNLHQLLLDECGLNINFTDELRKELRKTFEEVHGELPEY